MILEIGAQILLTTAKLNISGVEFIEYNQQRSKNTPAFESTLDSTLILHVS